MAVDQITNEQLVPRLAPFVIGAGWDQPFIAEEIFPPTQTFARSFRYEKFNNQGLVDQGSTKRGRHSGSKILQPGKGSTVDAFLEEASAKIPLDVTDIAAAEVADQMRGGMPGVLSSADRLRIGRMRIIAFNNAIQKEKDAATLAFTNTNYDADLRVTDISFKTCKVSDIKRKFRAVQKKYGFMVDTFALGYESRLAFDENENFLDAISRGRGADQAAALTDQALADLLGVKRIKVGMSVTQTRAEAGAVGTVTTLWTEDTAAAFYSGAFEQSDLASPAFGKVFYDTVPETGLRYATWAWLDAEPNTVEWQKAAEYYLIPSTPLMPAGVHFANTDQ